MEARVMWAERWKVKKGEPVKDGSIIKGYSTTS
jgi:hypothetical protein